MEIRDCESRNGEAVSHLVLFHPTQARKWCFRFETVDDRLKVFNRVYRRRQEKPDLGVTESRPSPEIRLVLRRFGKTISSAEAKVIAREMVSIERYKTMRHFFGRDTGSGAAWSVIFHPEGDTQWCYLFEKPAAHSMVVKTLIAADIQVEVREGRDFSGKLSKKKISQISDEIFARMEHSGLQIEFEPQVRSDGRFLISLSNDRDEVLEEFTFDTAESAERVMSRVAERIDARKP